MEQLLVILLVKLAVSASLASIIARSDAFQRALMREERTLNQRFQLALSFALIFGAGVAIRVVTSNNYQAVDLGIEGALVAGIVGGYVTGLSAGILISIPAMLSGELATMPLAAGIGVMGGLLRDCAPNPEEIWRFTPFFDLSIYRLFRKKVDPRLPAYHLFALGLLLLAEALRWTAAQVFGTRYIFSLHPAAGSHPAMSFAVFATTVFTVTLPLKIWNNTRNEKKLEEQKRLLADARLNALTSQINPHFLFNTLNSVSSLIRTDPNKARTVVYRLSNILRRLLRKHENLNPLREELSFIDDYLEIEMVRFGEKLRFVKEIAPDTLGCLVPSMLLQPLVENSIRHGLSSKVEGGMIRISSHLGEGRLHLLVEDDGVGIPEARLAKLFEQGIGVSNVNERLKVLFGNDYRMWIDSKPSEGTRTEIDIPDLQSTLAAVS